MRFYLIVLSLLTLLVTTMSYADSTYIIDRSQFTAEQWEWYVEEYEEAPFSLINGTVADPAEWPNSVWIGNCSATVVGAQVLASACHCMGNGRSVSFSKNGKRYSAVCTHHPEYRGNSTADWALCKISEPVEGGQYELLNQQASFLSLNMELTNTGYGCTKWGSGLDGKFRIGQSAIVDLPSGRDYDIVTRNGATLCSGDSGGASYIRFPDGMRAVAGVNSRSNTTTTSYMPSWATSSSMTWQKSWAAQNGVKICGVHLDAENCRSVKPPLPTIFQLRNSVVEIEVTYKQNSKFSVDGAKRALQYAIDLLEE